MKIRDVKREDQLQEWSGGLRELRQAACTALEQTQPLQLAEVPMVPRQEGSYARLRLTTKAGTLEIK